MILERLAVLSEAFHRRLVFRNAAVAVAPGAHDVEALERETRWIHFAMAGCAARIGPVLVKLLADGDGSADIGFDRGDGRRRWNFEAEDTLDDPFAAQHGRGGGAVGGDLEHAGLRHDPAARAVGRQRHPPHGHAVDPGHAVMRGEALIEEREVRVNQIAHRQIAAQQLGEEELRLGERGLGQRIVEVVIIIERGRGCGVLELSQVDPIIQEGLHETSRASVGQHPLGLGPQHFRLAQLAAVGAVA